MAAADVNYGGECYDAAFDVAGRLATTGWDGKVRLYDPELHLLRTAETPGGKWPFGLTFLPGDMWPFGLAFLPGGKRPFGLAFSPDGKRLAVGYHDTTTVDIFDASTLVRLFAADTRGVDSGGLHAVAWSADGESLYAAGRWQRGGSFRLCRWSEGGRSALICPRLSGGTVMALRGLPGGRLAFATAEPQLGLLGIDGKSAWSIEPATADFRHQEDVLAVSADGVQVRFGYEEWGKSPLALFSVAERRLAPCKTAVDLATARTAGPGLVVKGWKDDTAPSLNGRPLALNRYEIARSLALTPDGHRLVLGAAWSLRLFGGDGKELWGQPVPEDAWTVNVSSDGRLVVAAYGDGTIRWHRLSDGEELLALYPHPDRQRWVLWTPQGYYTASPGSEDFIGWQVNYGRDKAPEFFTASRFRGRFHRPDVVTLVLDELDVTKAVACAGDDSGGTKATEAPLAQSLPPVVRIIAPPDDTSVDGDDVIVSYEAEASHPVRSVMVLVNGRLALRQPQQESESVYGLVSGRVPVPVPAGEVTISLIAENAQGASDPTTVRIAVRNGAPAATLLKPVLHLIAIGVSSYRYDNDLRLRFAAKDAIDVAERFVREEGGLYADVKPWPLRDDEADRRSILRTFREVQRGLQPGDVVATFLSGHGANEGARYYFLPNDVEADSPEAIADTGISHYDLRDALRRFFEAGCKVIALIDTCYSGDVVEAKALPPDVDIAAHELAQAENGVVVSPPPQDTRSRGSARICRTAGGFYREVRIPNLCRGLHLGGAFWPGPTATSTSMNAAPSSASSRPANPSARSPGGSAGTRPPSTASWAATASATATAASAATSP